MVFTRKWDPIREASLVRSQLARVGARAGVVVAAMLGSSATAGATTEAVVVAQASPLDALGAPVGVTAVGLGVTGMVAGVLRRKKATVQPENERR